MARKKFHDNEFSFLKNALFNLSHRFISLTACFYFVYRVSLPCSQRELRRSNGATKDLKRRCKEGQMAL